MKIKRMTGVVVGTIAAAVVLPLAAAWACTSLATLKLNPTAANTGTAVTAEGYGFARDGQGAPVEVRFATSDGPVLAKVTPNAQGLVKFSFTAPRARRATTRSSPRRCTPPATSRPARPFPAPRHAPRSH